MKSDVQNIARLERINYEAMVPGASVTPGVDLVIRDDVIITSSAAFPTPDTNHACLLRATPQRAPDLIAEIVEHFRALEVTPTLFLSPACTPTDLPERLLNQGFIQQDEEEAWMFLENWRDFVIIPPASNIEVRQITKAEALTFSEVFMTAFEMPVEYAPAMAQVLEPSVNLPDMYHYIALMDDQPVGVCSLILIQGIAILGSAGIVPVRRGHRVLNALAYAVREEAREHNVGQALLQTTAGTMFERFLRIGGFRRAFTRTCYVLP